MNINKTSTIMIVDDSVSVLTHLATCLSNYIVIQADSGEEALRLINSDIRCVIMDAKLPGLSGFETSKALWMAWPHLPIIMHAGYYDGYDEHDICKIVSYGFYSYLVKGNSSDEIQLNVRRACELYATHIENEQYKKALEQRSEELSQALDKLRKTQASVIHNDRTETTCRLLSSLSHRLKNPVVAIEYTYPKLKQAMEQLMTKALFDILAMKFPNDNYAIFLDVAMEVFNKALTTRAPTTLEMLGRQKEIVIMLKHHDIPADRKFVNNIIRFGLSTELLVELSQLNWQGDWNVFWNACMPFYDIGKQIKHTGNCAREISCEIQAILSAARQEKKKISKDIIISEVIDKALDILSFRLELIDLTKDYRPVPMITGYPVDLMYCFIYIIENAIDATDRKGSVTIKIRIEDNYVRISIIDDGKNGIPKEEQENIFNIYHTTKKDGYGTGVGLHNAKEIIVNEHHGKINIDSIPGKTRFDLYVALGVS